MACWPIADRYVPSNVCTRNKKYDRNVNLDVQETSWGRNKTVKLHLCNCITIFFACLVTYDYRQLQLFLKFTKAHFINFAASNFLPQLERGFFQNRHSVANNNCNAKRIYCVCQIILFLKNDSQLNLGSFHRSTSAFTNYFSYIFISLFR